MKARTFWTGMISGFLGAALALTAFVFYQHNRPAPASNVPEMQAPEPSGPSGGAIPVANRNSSRLMQAPFDFREIIKRTKDAVVHVRNTQIITPVYRWFYGYREGQPYKQEGTGSGVIISSDGYIVTNYHVIKDASELEVTLNDKRSFQAQIVGVDAQNDIAVLKIAARNLPHIPFGNSDSLEVGEWVLAIGNPFNLGTTVTAGIVSAKARDVKGDHKIDSFIQTDAVVNPGNSGGALINEKGELVGINTMIFSLTGSYIGYSFAIPSNIVRKITNDIIEYGSIQKIQLGFSGYELNDKAAKHFGLSQTEGIMITEVDPASDSYKKGLRPGDILIGMDDKKIATLPQMMEYIKSKDPGSRVVLTLIKPNGRMRKINVVLRASNKAYIGNLGIVVQNMARKELRRRGLNNGVKITAINNPDLAANGIAPGFVIFKINNTPVYSAGDVEQLLSGDNGRMIVEMLDNRNRVIRYIFQ